MRERWAATEQRICARRSERAAAGDRPALGFQPKLSVRAGTPLRNSQFGGSPGFRFRCVVQVFESSGPLSPSGADVVLLFSPPHRLAFPL
ncbi:hypothetical protein EVAR_56588_1 [Eumeta japonica]|uniref:Uncharacterized protein n=1 Tax=Eumeta variegata TaxID=151549 RepID=A0A4C1Z099_EUMVA|nr:hypothetical protein EVAR_56588_1 [Eumeta japonica]